MADHITEEEQIEALKNWWFRYGKRILLVFGVVFVGFLIWQYVDQQQRNESELASENFARLVEELSRHGVSQPISRDSIQIIGEIADSINKEYRDLLGNICIYDYGISTKLKTTFTKELNKI